MSVGSWKAPPIKEMPTGMPKMYPAGTVIWGYPATAGREGLRLGDPRGGNELIPDDRVDQAHGASGGGDDRIQVVFLQRGIDPLGPGELMVPLQSLLVGLIGRGPFLSAIRNISCSK